MTRAEVDAACWAVLESIAKKQCRRDALIAGSEYDITLRIAGEIKTKPFAAEAEAHLVVNHDRTRLKSHEPPMAHLIGHLLSLMSRPKREALLRELPKTFSAADNRLPDVDAGLIDAAQKLLEQLRAKIQQQVRGSLSTTYTVHHLTS